MIENPSPGRGKHYGEWLGDKRLVSYQGRLRAAIDTALAQEPASFDDFLSYMRGSGYTVNANRKHITFLLPGQKQATRMDTLRGEHTEAAVRERIGDRRALASSSRETAITEAGPRPSLLIDIEAILRQGKGEGYARWAKVFNLKQAAQTLIYLQEHGLDSYDALKEKTAAVKTRFGTLSDRVKELEAGLKANAELQKHIVTYSKTRDTYTAYRKAGYSKKFRDTHEADILLHQTAKRAFDALGYGKDKKIPSVASLRAAYAAALEEKKKAYAGYREAKAEMRDLLLARENVERLLNIPDGAREREPECAEV